jgi:hypothetical protein
MTTRSLWQNFVLFSWFARPTKWLDLYILFVCFLLERKIHEFDQNFHYCSFCSHHRSSDDHSPGYGTFYERNSSRLSDQETPNNTTSGTAAQFIRRPNNNYHSATNDGRGRTRDRHYRNGPYSTIVDRWVLSCFSFGKSMFLLSIM